MSWELSYKAGVVPWVRPGLNPAIDVWFPASEPDPMTGLRIFVPGCGTSPEPVAFARRGARVTAMDISSTAISKQRGWAERASVRGLDLIVGDMLAWRPAERFDAIYEQTALCAIPQAERAAYERMAFEALRPGGRLFALFMQTNRAAGPPFDCGLEAMQRLFGPSRWRWTDGEPVISPHPIGVTEWGYRLERI